MFKTVAERRKGLHDNVHQSHAAGGNDTDDEGHKKGVRPFSESFTEPIGTGDENPAQCDAFTQYFFDSHFFFSLIEDRPVTAGMIFDKFDGQIKNSTQIFFSENFFPFATAHNIA